MENQSKHKKKMKVHAVTNQIDQVASTLPRQGKGSIHSDTQGSYTGMGMNYESPEQDADDL